MNSHLRIIYAGTPDFSVAALEALLASPCEVVAVYTQPDRPAGRGRGFKQSPVKEKALQHTIPVYQPASFKDAHAVQTLTDLTADLMVVTAYGLLLPATVLEAPRLGCINIHASLLPRWRGAAPIQRAILAGDKKTGISIMQMDAGLDTGDVLAMAECEITAEETGASLHDKLMVLGAETLMATLPVIADQTVQRVKQDEAAVCYAKKLSKAEAKIDWSRPAAEIQRAIRAYNSWPVAYCTYNKKGRAVSLRIWQAELVVGAVVPAGTVPGSVIAESAALDGIDVVTGDGVLRITKLQAEGKRKMSVADFLHASSLLGQRLA